MAQAYRLLALLGEGSEKGQWPLPPFSLGEGCPPDLTLIPDTSVSPCMPLVPFKLLPCCWSSKGVNLSKWVHVWVFKRSCLGLQEFLPLSQSLPGFSTRKCGAYLPGTGTLGWGTGVGLGLVTYKISLPKFYPLNMGEVPAHSASAVLLPVWMDVVSLIP